MPAIVVATAFACAGPTAAFAQDVVSATFYSSTQGTVTHPTVGTDALASCQTYDGPNPIDLYPGGNTPPQPFQFTPTSWTLSTVLSCGLGLLSSDVYGVEVLSANHRFEDLLSNADLNDQSLYQNSGALPAISVDGNENLTTYVRPYRGPGDANAGDEVTETGSPITLVAYASAPLQVTPSSTTLSSTATATTAQFNAVVKTPEGVTVRASNLSWTWNFGDGGTSSQVSPKHRFAAGSWPVTVQVSEVNGGNGGTGNLLFQTPHKSTSGKTNQPGGTKPTKSKSPTGTENGKHSNHQGGEGGSHQSGGSGSGASTTPSQSTTPSTTTATQSTTGTASAATPLPGATTTPTTTTPPPHHTTPRRPKRATPTAPVGTLVTGRLVSDVITLPASSSPLVRATPAAAAPPQVRQATSSRSLAAPAAGLAVALLLGLGAWSELRGRRRWRAAFARR